MSLLRNISKKALRQPFPTSFFNINGTGPASLRQHQRWDYRHLKTRPQIRTQLPSTQASGYYGRYISRHFGRSVLFWGVLSWIGGKFVDRLVCPTDYCPVCDFEATGRSPLWYLPNSRCSRHLEESKGRQAALKEEAGEWEG